MSKYAVAPVVVPFLVKEGPVCPCQQFLCDPKNDPYCPRSAIFCGNRGSANYTSPDSGPAAGSSLVDEFDARAAITRERVKQDLASREKPKRTRRTREQMAAHRASVAERVNKSTRELLGDGHWLLEPDADPILEEAMRHDDQS
jgi:hypothetical protein